MGIYSSQTVENNHQQGDEMLIDQLMTTTAFHVGHASWSLGFVPARQSLFEEVRKCPEAVISRLMEKGEWDLAELLIDNFVK